MVSASFTWLRSSAEKLASEWARYYDHVQVGGPAYGDPGGEFTPGMFLKTGCTITSRGCPKRCPWCLVPAREGPLRLLAIKPGWIVQDNNLLATPHAHFAAVFDMLRAQRRRIYFNGGLDKRFLEPWHVPFFNSVPVGELWWSCDAPGDLGALAGVRELFPGLPIRKQRCYVMIGYNGESLADAERRLETVFNLGFMPFSQLYEPPDAVVRGAMYSADWKALNRRWSRPAAIMTRGALETTTPTT
jgi:hypothetical protein